MREIGYTKSDKLYDYPELMTCPFCGKMPEMAVNYFPNQGYKIIKGDENNAMSELQE